MTVSLIGVSLPEVAGCLGNQSCTQCSGWDNKRCFVWFDCYGSSFRPGSPSAAQLGSHGSHAHSRQQKLYGGRNILSL